MSYRQNKIRARTHNSGKSETDQQAVQDTDRMVIINQLLTTGTAPGAPQAPMYGDFTQYPTDLRGFIESARRMPQLKESLPEAFRNMTNEQLLSLTDEEFKQTIYDMMPKPASSNEANE